MFIGIMLDFIFIYYVVFSFADYVFLCVCRSWLCLIDPVMTHLVKSLLGSIVHRPFQIWRWYIMGSGFVESLC